jgi:pimeloyl-ACP methyl ester carboxylesterase
MADAEMADANVPGIMILPGMMLDGRAFPGLSERLRCYGDVTVGDLTQDDSIATMATRALAGAPARFAVIGLSMGGIVALELWRRARARISHLALLDTTPYADHPERRELRRQQMQEVETGRLREVVVDSLKPRYLAGQHRSNRNLLARILDMALELGPAVFRRQSVALMNRVDSDAMLQTIDCPTLVLCGREDELCPPEVHEHMARGIPRADLVVLPDCGHLSPMESPAEVASSICRLLERRS